MTRSHAHFAPRALLAPFALLACGALPLIANGCSVKSLSGAEYTGPKNGCTDVCDEGASCVEGACRANTTQYAMLVEITPPASAHYGGNLTFSIEPKNYDGGTRPWVLPGIAHVTLRLDATGIATTARPIALSARLTRVGAVPGAAVSTYEARSSSAEGGEASKGVVSIDVPTGDYDVYLAPIFSTDPAFETAPLEVVPALPLGTVAFRVAGAQERVVVVGALKSLDMKLTDETSKDFAGSGYLVTAVDRANGDRIVSTVDDTCGHPSNARLMLAPGLKGHTFVIRFAPKSCSTKAEATPRLTFDFELDGIDVDGSGNGAVSIPTAATLGAPPYFVPAVSGRVLAAVSKRPLASSILFHSRSVKLNPTWKTGTAWFETQSQSPANGSFDVPTGMPAGNYAVEVIPDQALLSAQDFAITENEGDAGTGVIVDGKSLELRADPKTPVHGRAVSSDGSPFQLGTLDAVASPSALATSTGSSPFPFSNRSASITLGGDAFNLALDAGAYDFIVKIPDASGYPWIVRAVVPIAKATTATPKVDLGNLRATAPVVFTGQVLDPNGDPVARATIRARALIPSAFGASDPPIGAVEVGEAKAGEDGSYTLLVPGTIERVGAGKQKAK